MGELILGIDDAGRGPVIGPMILAGCLIRKSKKTPLQKLGVKDSKDLTQKRREFLAQKIKESAEAFDVIIVSPNEIDGNGEDESSRLKLNELEARACARIINQLNRKNEKIKVIVDCPSTNPSKWKDYLLTQIEHASNLDVSCEHKADKNHVSVSAASILAKCVREEEMAKLRETYGEEIGSGYTSDPLTIKFVEKYAAKYEDHGIFRKTWITWQKAYSNLSQRRLV